MGEALVEVCDLRKHFAVTRGLLRRTIGYVKAVDGVSFTVGEGETLGLVGESGCGKTTTAKVVLRLERPTAGTVLFAGKALSTLGPAEMRSYRSSVQAVFQDPFSSLNPRMRVASIVAEPLAVNDALQGGELRAKVAELLLQVGLRPEQADLYPHEFSGGQRQRIAIARALSLRPKLIVLDEPVSALDVSIRAQIMNLLKDLQAQYGLSYLLIAHNLATVRYLSQRIAVMYLGKIVETAESEEFFARPLHPYAQALMAAAMPSHPDAERQSAIVLGEVPSPLNPPPGCAFHPRCPFARSECSQVTPTLREVQPGHQVACHLY